MGDANFEYEVPPGTSELGKQRLAQLVGLAMQRKVNRHKPGPGQKENLTLELMAKDVGLGTSRFYTPKSKTLVNTKCLIAKILQACNLGDAVPTGWEVLQPRVQKAKLASNPFQDPFLSLPVADATNQELPGQDKENVPRAPAHMQQEGGHAKQLGPCRERSVNPRDISKWVSCV